MLHTTMGGINTAPQVDDLLAAVTGTTASAQLASPNKVLGEHLTHGLKAAADMSLNIEAVWGARASSFVPCV